MMEDKQNPNMYKAYLDSSDLYQMPSITINCSPFEASTHNMAYFGWKCRIKSNKYAPRTIITFYQNQKYGIVLKMLGYHRCVNEIFTLLSKANKIYIDPQFNITKGGSYINFPDMCTDKLKEHIIVEPTIKEFLAKHGLTTILEVNNELEKEAARNNPLRKRSKSSKIRSAA